MATTASALSRFTLGVKLTIFATVLVLGICGSMAYFLVFRSAADRTAAMEDRFSAFARIIAGMRATGYQGRQYDPFLVKILVEHGAVLGTDLCFVVFEDSQQKLEGIVNQKSLEEAAPALVESLRGRSEEDRLAALRQSPDYIESVRIKTVPVQSSKGGPLVVTAVLGFSTVELKAQIRDSLLANGVVTLAAFFLGMIGAVWLSRLFSQPIREVAAAMQRVAGGELDETLEVRSRDEVGVLAHAFNIMTQGLRERERIRHTFARYVSDEVAQKILREDSDVGLQGELRDVTVLFLDIRGFTFLAENLRDRPWEVVSLLNDYFEIIIDVIFRFEGTINKFIGDSIMAIYGAPRTIDLPEFRAVITAVEIQRAVGEFNWQRMQEGKLVANFGIGIHSGEAIAGNIGSARRMEYTVIGRDVNLAQRIESATREGQILLSDMTFAKVSHLVEAQAMEPVIMKGIAEPIPLYEVLGLKAKTIEEVRARVASG